MRVLSSNNAIILRVCAGSRGEPTVFRTNNQQQQFLSADDTAAGLSVNETAAATTTTAQGTTTAAKLDMTLDVVAEKVRTVLKEECRQVIIKCR